MANRTNRGSKELHPLVNKFFHSRPNGLISWQGKILALVSEAPEPVFLVQLYDWIMGDESSQELVPLAQMINEKWLFYDTGEDMKFSYEHGSARSYRSDLQPEETTDSATSSSAEVQVEQKQ